MSTAVLEITPRDVAGGHPRRYTSCGEECHQAVSCAYCHQPACQTHPGDDEFEMRDTCLGEGAHDECHRLHCEDPMCWVDLDEAWDGRVN